MRHNWYAASGNSGIGANPNTRVLASSSQHQRELGLQAVVLDLRNPIYTNEAFKHITEHSRGREKNRGNKYRKTVRTA